MSMKPARLASVSPVERTAMSAFHPIRTDAPFAREGSIVWTAVPGAPASLALAPQISQGLPSRRTDERVCRGRAGRTSRKPFFPRVHCVVGAKLVASQEQAGRTRIGAVLRVLHGEDHQSPERSRASVDPQHIKINDPRPSHDDAVPALRECGRRLTQHGRRDLGIEALSSGLGACVTSCSGSEKGEHQAGQQAASHRTSLCRQMPAFHSFRTAGGRSTTQLAWPRCGRASR